MESFPRANATSLAGSWLCIQVLHLNFPGMPRPSSSTTRSRDTLPAVDVAELEFRFSKPENSRSVPLAYLKSHCSLPDQSLSERQLISRARDPKQTRCVSAGCLSPWCCLQVKRASITWSKDYGWESENTMDLFPLLCWAVVLDQLKWNLQKMTEISPF